MIMQRPDAGDLHAEYRCAVSRLRRLLTMERAGGIVELPCPAPPRAPRPETSPAADPAPRPAISTAHRVGPPDLPAGVMDAFGDLPSQVEACRRCALGECRTRSVFGEGAANADLVFCGEAPGHDEDLAGRPFVGRAGELLTRMIEAGMGLRREEVFILNTLKCRPPGNRTPGPDEIAACRPWLEAQLAVIRPRVIVALGNPAVQSLLGPVGAITRVRGKVFEAFGARVVPTFHPAYLLRNPDAKREAWEDLKLVLRLLA